MNRALDVATSFAASVARMGGGMQVGQLGRRPKKRLELYEFEACPYCRKVREALSILDLEAMIYPCPKGGARFRREVERRGGKAQFPYLVDPNTDK
jgi:glutaredoxin